MHTSQLLWNTRRKRGGCRSHPGQNCSNVMDWSPSLNLEINKGQSKAEGRWMKTGGYLWRGSENPVGNKRAPKRNRLVGDRRQRSGWMNTRPDGRRRGNKAENADRSKKAKVKTKVLTEQLHLETLVCSESEILHNKLVWFASSTWQGVTGDELLPFPPV